MASYPSGQRDLTVNQTRKFRGFESLTRHPLGQKSFARALTDVVFGALPTGTQRHRLELLHHGRVTLSLDRGPWLFRHFDTYDDVTPYRFRFLRWVESGERDDLAAVEIVDPWASWEGEPIALAVLAARHVGTDLRSLEAADLPAHVHILTSAFDMSGVDHFKPSDLARTAWATVAPVGAALPEPPAFQAAIVRPDPTIA
jgi:hypothetical protein